MRGKRELCAWQVRGTRVAHAFYVHRERELCKMLTFIENFSLFLWLKVSLVDQEAMHQVHLSIFEQGNVELNSLFFHTVGFLPFRMMRQGR